MRLNLRADGHFGVDDGKGQALIGEVTPNTWYAVRFRFEKDNLLLEISTDRKLWWTLHSQPQSGFKGDPVAVRLGKMNAAGEAVNFNVPGPVGKSRIREFRVYGRQSQEK